MGLFDSLFSALGGGPQLNASGGGMGFQGPVGGSGGFNWLPFVQMLGQMGGAISPQNSWQSRLGNASAGMANNKIYGNAAAKGQVPIQDYLSQLFTPKGSAGPTGYSVDKNGEATLTMGPTNPSQSMTQPTATPQSTMNQAGMGAGNYLPFL